MNCPPPQIQTSARPLEVRQGQCRGPQQRSIGFIQATDGDGGALTYAVRPGSGVGGASQFTVDQQTGEITTTGSFTTATQETIQIQVTDDEGATTDSTLQVRVNCQNQPPAFDSPTYNWVMSPQVCLGGDFPTLLTATDPEGEPVQYEILSGDPTNAFTITDGRLTALPPSGPNDPAGDPPAGPPIQLQIVARDAAQPIPGEGRATVTVDFSACVNTPPVFDQPNQRIELRQCDGQTSPIQVGRATARDEDQDELTYTITSPTDNSYTIAPDG